MYAVTWGLVGTGSLVLTALAAPAVPAQAPDATAVAVDVALYRRAQPPPAESGERSAGRIALHKAYALGGSERIRLVVSPFPRARAEWMRVVDGRNLSPRVAKHLGWVWDEQHIAQCFEHFSADSGVPDVPALDLVVYTLKMDRSEVEGPGRALLDRPLSADVVIRAETSREQAVEPLARGLREQAGVPVRLALGSEHRDVWLAKAPAARAPVPPKVRAAVPAFHPMGSPLDGLSLHVGRRVVCDDPAALPPLPVTYRMPRNRAADAADEGAVLKRVTEQTGITFARERREVRVLTVEKAQ